ncbi:hypothetical protein SAMD00023353_1700530 [Rosellinia necatrix]|uniref:Utp8 beta-propeller domain-containing protein n=1 Tax=Rosellinia necatrix TaxID=77044 RepID=A0A1W2TKS5_ROSNE|nr:hypothetical protein SAMD00023353_1700530 [Rosellinia necatrix]
MASQFQVQKPYVLTTLPRPLDPITGTYVVGEVYGYAPGSKKRKRRAELTVGIDGEAINIYDVSSSRLVTSYPIPPQSRLSCPASSIRLKSRSAKDVARYTYAASDESRMNKITLFKDSVGESGKTNQVTCSASLGPGRPAVWLAPASNPAASGEAATATPNNELLVVRADGEITCLDGESLTQKWTSTALAMLQDLADNARTDFTIEFCRSIPASEVVKGIFKGNSDVFNIISNSSQGLDEESEVFVLVSSSGATGHRTRHIHIIGRLSPTLTSTHASQGVVQLHVMPLADSHEKQDKPRHYRLDIRNGALLELHHHTIIIHDLTASVPKITSTMPLEGTNSFLPLSKTSLLCSTNTQLSVFNPVYKSLQNTVDIDLASQGQTDSRNSQDPDLCRLVAYFSPLERAISIVGSNLVAIQLEAPKSRHVKRRAEGLLIDSIGRGLPTTKRESTLSSGLLSKKTVFSNYLPGSIRGDYWERWTADREQADSLLNANDIPNFETLLAEKFGIPVEAASPSGDNTDILPKNPLIWRLPRSRTNYPHVDRRWILYAISRSFQWNNALPDDLSVPRLIFQLPQSNILNYLVDAGHLTMSNLRAAFRDRLVDHGAVDSFLAEELVTRLSEIDPSLELLVVYLSATNLGALETLLVLKTLMKSLELVNGATRSLPKAITTGAAEDGASGDDTAENENIGMELDDLEDEIQKTVSYLNNEDAGVRGRGLSIAFAKLGACPAPSAVKGLRTTFKPEEVLSLMYVLRIELVKGGWTDRYLEVDSHDGVPFDAPPDGIIKLIADLLGFCLDSLGPGGWLLGDAMQAGDDAADFIGSLTHEVSAALEGLEETVYLRNFLAGPVKYYEETLNKAASAAAKDANANTITTISSSAKPVVAIRLKDPVAGALPLGLKSVSQQVSSHKVVSGGEVVQRSLRERGHLISQKVGSYSLERIVV